MMRTPNAYAVAVRRADGTITHTGAPLPKWSDKLPLLKLPVLRGGAVLVQSMALGIKALNYSANEAFAEAEEAEAKEVKVALSPAVIEGEGDFAGLTGAVPGLIPVPTQKRSKDELKKGTTPMLILSLLEAEQRHGYELSKLLEKRTNGVVRIHAASLYPLLYRLEERGWLQGKWVEKAGERRRRFYSLTAEGRRVLAKQRTTWQAFVEAVRRITETEHA